MAIFSGETCGVCPYGAGFAPTVLPTAAVPVAAEPVDPMMDLEASTDGRGKMMKNVCCLVPIWKEHGICLVKEL